MYTYILLIVVIAYLLITLSVVKNDFFFPPVIVLLVYILSLCFAILEINKWDIHIQETTFCVFVIGLSCYVWVGLACYFFCKYFRIVLSKTTQANRQLNQSKKRSLIEIDLYVTLIMIVFDILVLAKYYLDVRHSSSLIGSFTTLGEMIGNYRNAGVMGELEVGISNISKYGYVFMTAIAYIYLYVFIQRLALKYNTTKLWKILNCLPIILYVLCSLLTGGRNPLLQLACAGVVLYYVFQTENMTKTKSFHVKFALKLVVIAGVVLIIFSNIRGLVGRTNDYDFIDYIAMYMGAPIKLFDMFIQDPPINSVKIWGQETFVNVWRDIGVKTGNMTWANLIMNKEWRKVNGIDIGNVYTAFREYMHDFGISGVIILSSLHSTFFTIFHLKIVKNNKPKNKNKIDFALLVYSYIVNSLFYYSIDDRFFQAYFSLGTLRVLIVMFILAWILPKVKIIGGKLR